MKIVKKSILTALAISAMIAASPAVAQNVKIGFIGGFTGPIENLVPPIFEGAKLAVAHINEQGGVLGQTLELISSDGGCDSTLGASAADKLVNTDQVTAIVGAVCSGETIAAASNAAIPGNVTIVSPSASSPAVTTVEDNDLLFRVSPSDSYQGDVLARLILSKGITTIAVSYINNDYGKGLADAVVASYVANGGTVAASEGHEEGKADYRAEVGSLAATGADTLVVLAYASGSGQTILRQATEGGDFANYVFGDGMIDDALMTGIDAASIEGAFASPPGAPDGPGAAIFAEAAAAAGLDPTAIFSPQAYDAAFMVALAIEKNGSADREGVSAALRSIASAPGEVILPGEWEKAVALIAAGKDINYEGAGGAQDFDENGDVAGTYNEQRIENGAFVTVGPAS